MEEDFKKRLLKVTLVVMFFGVCTVTPEVYIHTDGHFQQAKTYVTMLQEREQKQEKTHQQEVCTRAIYIYTVPCNNG